ncbi:Homeobox [Macrophomina phaseolina MS6]|uniref:Homeobox n=1 Tax=Macrophomina phaseolina (strain MS6) TaxID=1126212 RepID=K2RD99_MACPH|nr:Homeobox [Macrophomina phaseolina MS6]
MNLISRFWTQQASYTSALGANIFEPRPSDAPRSSLEGFLAEVADCIHRTPTDSEWAQFASMDVVESSSSSPLVKPLAATFSSPPTPESLSSKIGYVTQHALPRIGTWKSTEKCAFPSDSGSPSQEDLGGRSESNDQSEYLDDRGLLSDYYENLSKLHFTEQRIRNLEVDMKGMQVMQSNRSLLGQQPLFIDPQLWSHLRQSLDDRLDQLQRQNEVLRSDCIKRGLLLLPNPSAFKRSASVSTAKESGRMLPEPGITLTNRHRSTTLPAAVVEQALSNHRSDRKRIPRAAKAILEYHFSLAPLPSDVDIECLAQKTGLPAKRVKTWFFTKRALCKGNHYPT